MRKYETVSSIATALKELGICEISQQVLRRKYVLEACEALGMSAVSTMDAPTDKTKYTAVEGGAIVRWLADKYTVQKQPRNYGDKYKYKTLAFNTDKDMRHVIKLEIYYIDALKQIGIDNIPAFLARVTATEWNATTGDRSIMKIVKREIVNALLNKKVGRR